MLMKLTAPLTITYLVTLMANINDGTNRLVINDTEIPSSQWVGTGTYTYTNGTRSITIEKIVQNTGNIMIEQITGSSYKLVAKDTDTRIYAENVVYESSDPDWPVTDVQEAITELKDDKVSGYMTNYDANTDYSVLANRIAAITTLYNRMSLDNGEFKVYTVRYASYIYVRYIFWKKVYTASSTTITKVHVEEICEYQGIYRQYMKLNTAAFVQKLCYSDFVAAKTIEACTPVSISGITVTGFNFSFVSDWVWFGTAGRIVVGTSAVALASSFQIGNYYYFILGQFGSDAEEVFTSVANDTILFNPVMMYFTPSNMGAATYRIVKHNNKIYWCYRNTANSYTYAANIRVQMLPHPIHQNMRSFFNG